MRKLMLGAAALLLAAGSAYAIEEVYTNSTVTYDDKLNGTDATNPNISISATVASITTAGLRSVTGSATVDVASLVDAAGATSTVTCTGAALGDFVLVSHSLDVQDITVTAYVQAANACEVRFQNEGAATVDLASGTVRVVVIPKATFGF